jgi:hypothetical protein
MSALYSAEFKKKHRNGTQYRWQGDVDTPKCKGGYQYAQSTHPDAAEYSQVNASTYSEFTECNTWYDSDEKKGQCTQAYQVYHPPIGFDQV